MHNAVGWGRRKRFVTLTEILGREKASESVQNVKTLVKNVKIGLDNLVNVWYNKVTVRKTTCF